MYHEASISGSDRSACEKIFTITLDDPNPAVRAALSNGLANSSVAPVALVWALASDIAEVSCQLIEQSPKLGSEALCSLLKSTDEAVQSAIARRRILDGTTVRTLVQIGEPRAVLELLKNTKVLLGPMLKHDIAERVGHDPDIRAHLLTIGETATIKGEVVADDVVVNGRIVGRVRGLKVRLTSTARVEGDIIHKTIAIESGAHFEGSVQRQDDPLNNKSTAPSPKAAAAGNS